MVGREVVRQLADRGIQVRALARNPQKAQFLKRSAVEILPGDLEVPGTIAAALKGVEKVFLLSPADPRQVELQGNVVAAAQRSGVLHIVKLSTLGASPNSPLAQARWHRQTEEQIEASGIAFTHLRPHNFMQNTLNFAPSIAAEGQFRAPLGEGKISLVDARDVAAVAAACLTEDGHEGRIYRITGPEALTYYQVTEKISTAIDKEITYMNISSEEARKTMIGAGMSEWYVNDLIELYRQFQEGKGARVTDTIQRIAGKPPITYDRFALDYAHVFKGDFSEIKPGIL